MCLESFKPVKLLQVSGPSAPSCSFIMLKVCFCFLTQSYSHHFSPHWHYLSAHCPCSDLLAFLIFSLDFLFFLPQHFPANTKKFAFQRNYQYFLWSTNQSISRLIRILVLVIFGFVHGSHYSESNTISFCFKNSVLHSASYAWNQYSISFSWKFHNT